VDAVFHCWCLTEQLRVAHWCASLLAPRCLLCLSRGPLPCRGISCHSFTGRASTIADHLSKGVNLLIHRVTKAPEHATKLI
jgi:hypothetical protein